MQEGQPVFGEAMRRTMAERGCDMSLEDAQEFARTLLRLIDLHALEFVHEDGNTIPLA